VPSTRKISNNGGMIDNVALRHKAQPRKVRAVSGKAGAAAGFISVIMNTNST
jgi:hypothetical protein